MTDMDDTAYTYAMSTTKENALKREETPLQREEEEGNIKSMTDPSSASSRRQFLSFQEEESFVAASRGRGMEDGLSFAQQQRLRQKHQLQQQQRQIRSTPPRMIERNLPFCQSHNRFAVRHNASGWSLFLLIRHDWFHVFLNQPTYLSLTFLLMIWTGMILVFAALYRKYDHRDPDLDCGLGQSGTPIEFGAAFAFSLQTCTTVGYTLPSGINSFFENCQGLQTLIYMQMVWSMLFNAFLFAFFYTRLARSSTRAIQVIFSKQALVADVNNQIRFQVRCFDIDSKHPVVEAHVRLYAMSKQRPVPRPLRILQPNDELGGMLFLSMPSVVSHHVDVYSMLHPPVEHSIATGGLILRQVDSAAASREEFICPACAESYGTHERWVKHVTYQRIVERIGGYRVEGTHLSIPDAMLENAPAYPIQNVSELQTYFRHELAEIVCVVEGIDPITSGTFQALQSYRYEDIVWEADGRFQPCLNVQGRRIHVDMDRFHGIEVQASALVGPAEMTLPNTHNVHSSNNHSGGSSGSTTTNTRPARPQFRPTRSQRKLMTQSIPTHDSFVQELNNRSER